MLLWSNVLSSTCVRQTVFLEAPQVNKEIYGHLSAATDGVLLDAQADLLTLVIPIINVMESINKKVHIWRPSDSLSARSILKQFADAITLRVT